MSEDDWNRCTNPQKMLAFLRGNRKASGWKLRLFGVICCQRVCGSLTAEARALFEVARRVAEGTADERERRMCRVAAMGAGRPSDPQISHALGLVKSAASCALARRPWEAAREAASTSLVAAVNLAWIRDEVLGGNAPDKWMTNLEARRAREREQQATLLRELFGPLPFCPVAVPDAWVAWNGGTVRRLAESIYERRAFGEMGVLADVLEEAGCHDAAILGHCRTPGQVHARGCWVLDLVLQKE
jgi:hypothetical protein